MTISNKLWQSIQRDYETSKVSNNNLALVYGISARTITRRAQSHKWRKNYVPKVIDHNVALIEQIIEVPEYELQIQSGIDYKLKYREQVEENNYKNALIQKTLINNTSELVKVNPLDPIDAVDVNHKLAMTTKALHTDDKQTNNNITVNTQINIYSDMTDDDLIRERMELKERLL